ncbi:hypothetical protein B7463_g12354, partial [Scytalidium lignicola]
MALQEQSANAQWPQRLKKGPKIKLLEKRTYTPRIKPITSACRSYTRERKIEVLKFLLYHKVVVLPSATYQKYRARSGMPLELEPIDSNSTIKYRSVTIEEASEFWKIATVSGHTDRNGIQRIKPKIIFHGTVRPSGQIYTKEKHLYHLGVTVEFNPTTYNNEELFMQWIDEELILVANQNNTLLVMDVATFHKTNLILNRLKSANITTALIPPSCTSLLQPLDTAVNGPFKQWLREESDQYMESVESEHPDFKWTTSDNIQPDGSEDSQIKVKDILDTAIDFTGWESIDFDVEYVKNELFKEVPEAVDNMEEVILEEEDVIIVDHPACT